MKKTINIAFMMVVFVMTTIFFAGCKKEQVTDLESNQQILSNPTILEDVSDVSIPRLAEMQYDQSVSTELYKDIEDRISSLSENEFALFMEEWARVDADLAIKTKTIANDKENAQNQSLLKLLERNKKSKELFGIPLNKLMYGNSVIDPEKKIEKLMQELEGIGAIDTGIIISKASCPTYSYPYPTANNGAGIVSCSGYVLAGNPGTTDCDYEFIFYPGPISYTASNLKTKGTTTSANWILNAGGVNGRTSASPSFRILIGKNRINLVYPVAGAGGFASAFKFR